MVFYFFVFAVCQVVVPRNYPEYTSRKVHVAEWLEGEKLSQVSAHHTFMITRERERSAHRTPCV
jgi:predicted unusual protein kinase regulating ubiquinone biosynthesis (AarF/ABC1/UbiB family)